MAETAPECNVSHQTLWLLAERRIAVKECKRWLWYVVLYIRQFSHVNRVK